MGIDNYSKYDVEFCDGNFNKTDLIIPVVGRQKDGANRMVVRVRFEVSCKQSMDLDCINGIRVLQEPECVINHVEKICFSKSVSSVVETRGVWENAPITIPELIRATWIMNVDLLVVVSSENTVNRYHKNDELDSED